MRAAHLGVDACRGLEAVHSAGLVHRDLKPENLFVTRGDDGRDVVKLLDFGVVKSSTESNATTPGALIGTARYMAPEQASDEPLGPTSDIFSLGVILYESLTGKMPFDADTLERVLFKIVNYEPAPLTTLVPNVPQELADVIHRAMAKTPKARYPNAKALGEALLRACRDVTLETNLATVATLPETLAARPDSERPAADAPRRARRRIAWAMAAIGLGAGGMALAQGGIEPRRGEPAVNAQAPAPSSGARAARTLSPLPHTPPALDVPPMPSAAVGSASAVLAPRTATAARKPATPPPRTSSSPPGTSPKQDPPAVSFDPANPYVRDEQKSP
jgi:serine/threonine-protein kinase